MIAEVFVGRFNQSSGIVRVTVAGVTHSGRWRSGSGELYCLKPGSDEGLLLAALKLWDGETLVPLEKLEAAR